MPAGFRTHAEPPHWIRGPAHLDGNWIVIDRERAVLYLPLSAPKRALMSGLQGATTPDHVVRFVSSYGLLKHGPDAPQLREPLADFESEVTLLRSVLVLVNAVRGAVKGDHDQLELVSAASPVIASAFQAVPQSDEELLMQTSKAIAWVVSEKLQNTTIRLDAACEYDLPDNRPGVFAFNVAPPNLLGWVYHELAQTLVGRVPLSTCPTCLRVFVREDGRQRFCEPACANRARFQRFATKRKEAMLQQRPQQKGRRSHATRTKTQARKTRPR